MKFDDLQLPVYHLNGSGRDNLMYPLRNAYDKLHEAIGALIEMSPHARDYYPLGPGAFEKARDEHRVRIAALYVVYEEIGQLAVEIDQSFPERKK